MTIQLLDLARKAEEALRRVVVPGFDIDIVTAGIAKKITLSKDGRSIAVFLSYSEPSCFFCRFINWNLWRKILEKAEQELRSIGFIEIEFFDYTTGLRLKQ